MNQFFAVTGRYSSALISLAILGLIAVVYWPAFSGGFVWDDNFFLHDSAWVWKGDYWVDAVLHGFREWNVYYRPLGVALFALEAHAFDLSPGPMHLVSICIHLANVLLVGMLARLVSAKVAHGSQPLWPIYSAMLLFGLHPALIEPVAWVSAQFELLVTFFIMSGLILNVCIPNRIMRAAGVALCFFLAACSKEAAVSFPLLLFLIDWFCAPECSERDQSDTLQMRQRLLRIAKDQWPVYLAVLAAGFAYLGLRAWGLGLILNQDLKLHWTWLQQLQIVCFTYLTYWRLLVWPMSGLAPIHIISQDAFAAFEPKLFADNVAALTIAFSGLWLAIKRRGLGILIVGVSMSVLPVLHIVSLHFDDSLYHERYAMTAIAIACASLPLLYVDMPKLRSDLRWVFRPAAIAGAAWLVLAVANIRVTLPLWSSEIRLWEWGLLRNPTSIKAQEYLLSSYLQSNDLEKARALAIVMMQGKGSSCAACMLNIASMNITLRDQRTAASALQQAKKNLDKLYPEPHLILAYILLSGELEELKGNTAEAEEAYRAAISFEPLNFEGHMRLALLLPRLNRLDEARKAAADALSLVAPDRRAEWRNRLEMAIAPPIDASDKNISLH